MYVYESDNLNVRVNVNLTVCVRDLEQSYVRVSVKVVRVKSECLSVNVRARVNILSVSVFFVFFETSNGKELGEIYLHFIQAITEGDSKCIVIITFLVSSPLASSGLGRRDPRGWWVLFFHLFLPLLKAAAWLLGEW